MVDIKHHQSVQVAVPQLPRTFLDLIFRAVLPFLLPRDLIEEIAAERVSRQLLLQLLCPCQQLLFVALPGKGFLGLLRGQFARFPEQELLEVRILKPCVYGRCPLAVEVSLDGCLHGPAGIDVPLGLLASHFPPEVPSAAFHGRGLPNIFLITESLHSNSCICLNSLLEIL